MYRVPGLGFGWGVEDLQGVGSSGLMDPPRIWALWGVEFGGLGGFRRV